MSKPKLPIPEFNNEVEERAFWEMNDSTEYLDWKQGQLAQFPNLKPSNKKISLRIPTMLLDRVKIEANKRAVSYQSLIKIWIAEMVEK